MYLVTDAKISQPHGDTVDGLLSFVVFFGVMTTRKAVTAAYVQERRWFDQ